MSDNKYRIVITGTSSGLGKLTARALAAAGHRVFAGMRDCTGKNSAARDELLSQKNDQGGSIEVLDLDVTSDESVNSAIALVDSRAGGIDVLVNNAGLMSCGVVESFTLDQIRALYDVNVFGVLRMNRAVLPTMRRSNRGLLVHVSSVGGRYLLPFLGAYSSTKFALEAIAEEYHYELGPSGIESVIVQPGSFPTKIATNMLLPADASRADGYTALQPALEGFKAMLLSGANDPNAPDSHLVSNAIVHLVEAAPGTRPLRTVVDVHFSALVEQINRTSSDAQKVILGALGFAGMLKTPTPAT